MKNIGGRARSIGSFETLSLGATSIHRLHPLTKLLSALIYIITVVSFGKYDIIRLAPFIFFPVVVAGVAEIPYAALMPKLLTALPFCLFAGVSNLIFDRGIAFEINDIYFTYGFISMTTIIAKMLLSVSAALLLAATTPLTRLSAQLRRLRAPYAFVMSFEMTYRYIGVLLDEAHSMTTAYSLRGAGKKALDIKHMGSFAGQLLLRGFDRAERVYAAMRCRGYNLREIPRATQLYRINDGIVLGAVCAYASVFRFFQFW